MGNCIFGGMGNGEAAETIQVVTANGGIMEFQAPVTAGFILEDFPCHAIFNSDDLFWNPLANHEELCPGVSYLLLPLHTSSDDTFEAKVGHVRSKSIPATTTTTSAAPYRMSFDRRQSKILKRSNTDVFSRRNRKGVWKVNLSISSEQLLEILSQEARTQELIESGRTVAKWGSGGAGTGASLNFSDQWSTTSSRASSKKE